MSEKCKQPTVENKEFIFIICVLGFFVLVCGLGFVDFYFFFLIQAVYGGA